LFINIFHMKAGQTFLFDWSCPRTKKDAHSQQRTIWSKPCKSTEHIHDYPTLLLMLAKPYVDGLSTPGIVLSKPNNTQCHQQLAQ
jgi:hypothetical protein